MILPLRYQFHFALITADKIQKLNRSKSTRLSKVMEPCGIRSYHDNWQYTQDLLSTLPKSLDLDNGQNFPINPWQAKEAPVFTFTEDEFSISPLKYN